MEPPGDITATKRKAEDAHSPTEIVDFANLYKRPKRKKKGLIGTLRNESKLQGKEETPPGIGNWCQLFVRLSILIPWTDFKPFFRELMSCKQQLQYDDDQIDVLIDHERVNHPADIREVEYQLLRTWKNSCSNMDMKEALLCVRRSLEQASVQNQAIVKILKSVASGFGFSNEVNLFPGSLPLGEVDSDISVNKSA